MKNALVQKFENDSRWVNYRKVKKGDRMTKIPYSVDGTLASSTDSATWSTYATAKKSSPQIGIVFTPARNLLGIDLDHVLVDGKIEHEQKEVIAQLLLEANTYSEVSPSGDGLHLFLEIEGELKLIANKKEPFECYTEGRYFTVTENVYVKDMEVAKVTPEEALRLLSIIGYPWGKSEEKKSAEKVSTPSVSLSMDDSEILRRMFASKNGADVEKLYNGDTSEYKGDGSTADMGLLAHLAFWTAKNADQMERIWMSSPLGNREKTQQRKDYRDRSIRNAIAKCTNVYESQIQKMEKKAPDLDLLFVIGSNGAPKFLQNTENMCRILRKCEQFSGKFRFDSFKGMYEIKEGVKWRTLEDNDAVNVQAQISIDFKEWFGKVGKEMIYDAIIKVSKENAYDSAADFIKNIKWDGKARLDTWLSQVFGVMDNKYHKAVGSNWIKGLVKRLIDPGCKFDYVLVLEGKQGARKSTSLAILGGNWHVETAMSTESKDFFMQFQGKAIIEFSEGETLSRTEVKRMKAIITMQSDKYRPPYERTSQDFPRRCVFAMTTNQTEYLKDETGNRRWLPVTVMFEQAKTEWIEANREQMFAEAYHRLTVLKETVHEFPEEETVAEQNKRRIADPNEGKVTEWYYTVLSEKDRIDGISIEQVYKNCLHGGFASKPMGKFEEMSISSILRDSIKLERRQIMRNGCRMTRWFNTAQQQFIMTEEEKTEEILKGNW